MQFKNGMMHQESMEHEGRMKTSTQAIPKIPVKAVCSECGAETVSKGCKPRHRCHGGYDDNGKRLYSECEHKYWKRWQQNNRKNFRKGGKYYKTTVSRRPLVKTEPETTKRKCLKCEKQFESTSPYNRICKICSKMNEGVGMTAKKVSKKTEDKLPIYIAPYKHGRAK